MHFSFLLPLRLPYKMYFGGVSALTPDQYLKMNGFPNNYWGWGGEDDDIGIRWVSECVYLLGWVECVHGCFVCVYINGEVCMGGDLSLWCSWPWNHLSFACFVNIWGCVTVLYKDGLCVLMFYLSYSQSHGSQAQPQRIKYCYAIHFKISLNTKKFMIYRYSIDNTMCASTVVTLHDRRMCHVKL